MHITERTIAKLKPGEKRLQYFDDETSGLGVRVDVDNRKSFFWLRKINGKQVFRALCGKDYPYATVDAARTEAESWNGKAADWKAAGYPAGTSPFDKPKSERPSSTPTFRELVEAYIIGDVRPNAQRPERAEFQVRWRVKRHFSGPTKLHNIPSWLDRRIDTITTEDVLEVKRACGEKQTLANRCVGFVLRLFNWLSQSRDGKINFFRCDNPAKDVSMFEETPRVRFLDGPELSRFNEALKTERHTGLKHFLILAMATGARRGDLFSMRWCDVDFDLRSWRVPFPKQGEAYTVQLLPVAVDVLKRRYADRAQDEVYVFPGRGATGHVTDYRDEWIRFRERAQLENFHLHDIRHTHASYLAISNVPIQQIASALGHRSLQSTQIYAHLSDAAVRGARESGQRKMIETMRKAERRLATQNRRLSA